MRWFKHMTNSLDDEKLSIIVDEFGLEGYGFWWLVLEKIASAMDETDKTSIEYPLKKWQKLTGFSPKKLEKFIGFMENLGIFSSKFEKNTLKIDVPNLIRYRDEYSKKARRTPAQNSGQTPDKLRTMSGQTPEQEGDTDTDAETESKKDAETSPTTKRTRKPSTKKPKPVDSGHKAVVDYWFKIFEEQFGKKPHFTGKDGKLVKSLMSHGVEEICSRLDNYVEHHKVGTWFAKDGLSFGGFYANFDKCVKGPEEEKPRAPLSRIDIERKRQGYDVKREDYTPSELMKFDSWILKGSDQVKRAIASNALERERERKRDEERMARMEPKDSQ